MNMNVNATTRGRRAASRETTTFCAALDEDAAVCGRLSGTAGRSMRKTRRVRRRRDDALYGSETWRIGWTSNTCTTRSRRFTRRCRG